MTLTQHIRRPLPRKGGNSFYKDRGVRQAYTLCGAPVTDRDWDLRTALAKKHREQAERECCPTCLGTARAGSEA